MNIGIEIITKKNKNLYISFPSSEERDIVYNAIKSNVE